MTALIDPKLQREAELEQIVKEYILHGERFRFGGMVNLISTIRSIAEQAELDTRCKDFGTAAETLRKLEETLDLPYYWEDWS